MPIQFKSWYIRVCTTSIRSSSSIYQLHFLICNYINAQMKLKVQIQQLESIHDFPFFCQIAKVSKPELHQNPITQNEKYRDHA